MEPRRLRVARDGRGEHLCCGLERAKLHEVVSPVEQVILGRVHVRGALILLGRRDEIARTLFDVAEQVMKLTSLLRAQQPSDLLTRGV